MIHRVFPLFVLFAFFLSAQSWGQDSSEEIILPVLESVDQAMQRFVDQGQIAGAVTLVGHRGKVVHLGAVGLAEIEASKQMQSFKMFSIASMTKPVTATAVMILQDEGKLSVDDKISKYLPEFKNVKLIF